LSDALLAEGTSARPDVMSLFQVLFRVALILGAIVVVGVGVLFAGCVLALWR
jgi:hypothetical protein